MVDVRASSQDIDFFKVSACVDFAGFEVDGRASYCIENMVRFSAKRAPPD